MPWKTMIWRNFVIGTDTSIYGQNGRMAIKAKNTPSLKHTLGISLLYHLATRSQNINSLQYGKIDWTLYFAHVA